MARLPDGKEKPYRVEKLWEKHQEVLRLLVLGKTAKEVSVITGFSINFISNLRNSPLAMDRLEILSVGRDAETVEAATVIARAQPKAAKLLEAVLCGDAEASVGQQINVAQDILSRGGNSPVQRIKSEIQHGLTEEALEEIKQRRLDARSQMEADSMLVNTDS